MSQEIIKNIVEKYNYFDSAGDIDMLRVIYFDENLKEFKFKDFYGCALGDTVLEDAPIEIQDKYKLARIQENKFNAILGNWSTLIENGVCPGCREYTKIIENEKFLWVLSKKGLCGAPYKQRTSPKGSCKQYEYVTWCPKCQINFSIHNYHRSFSITIIKDLKKIGRISICTGMGETGYTLEIEGNSNFSLTDETTFKNILELDSQGVGQK